MSKTLLAPNITLETFQAVLCEIRDEYLERYYDNGFYHWNPQKCRTTFRKDIIPFAWDINQGDCEDYANEVISCFGTNNTEMIAKWHEDMPDYNEKEDGYLGHCFICFRGKCYDSECIEGVDSWRELPCCRPVNPRPRTIYKTE